MGQRAQLPIFLSLALDGNSRNNISAMMTIMIVMNENSFSSLNLLLLSCGVLCRHGLVNPPAPAELTGEAWVAGLWFSMPYRLLLLLFMFGHSTQELSQCSQFDSLHLYSLFHVFERFI